jgi:hypothetical protein
MVRVEANSAWRGEEGQALTENLLGQKGMKISKFKYNNTTVRAF